MPCQPATLYGGVRRGLNKPLYRTSLYTPLVGVLNGFASFRSKKYASKFRHTRRILYDLKITQKGSLVTKVNIKNNIPPDRCTKIRSSDPPENAPLFNKLAQLRKNDSKSCGKESDKTLYKRAIAKFFTVQILDKLLKLKTPLKSSYFQTYFCVKILLQKDNKITSKYCNNRWCIVCNRIRTAKLIKGYSSQLEKLNDLRLVTLTIPNVHGSELKGAIDLMLRNVRRVQDRFRYKGIKIKGVRKLECTYNIKAKTYHPHFHFCIQGKDIGDQMVYDWLLRYSEANALAQDNRPANIGAVKELFKYFTKLHKTCVRNGSKVISVYPAQALDTIFQAMYKRRVFQAMGGIRMVKEEVNPTEATVHTDSGEVEIWGWEQDWSDWYTADGVGLTGCTAYKSTLL